MDSKTDNEYDADEDIYDPKSKWFCRACVDMSNFLKVTKTAVETKHGIFTVFYSYI